MTIPELPPGFPVKVPPESLPHPHLKDWTVAYTADQMRAYGEACYRAGMERAAVIATEKAEGIRRVNTYRGKVNGPSGFAAEMVDDAAAAIRAEAAKCIEPSEKHPPAENNGEQEYSWMSRARGCSLHPAAPHGFDRDASHAEGRYVCECESWEPPPAEAAKETK